MKYINLFLLTSVYSMNDVCLHRSEKDQNIPVEIERKDIFDNIYAIYDEQHNLIYEKALKIIKEKERLLGHLLDEERINSICYRVESDEISKWIDGMIDKEIELHDLSYYCPVESPEYQAYQNFKRECSEKKEVYYSKKRQRRLRDIAKLKEKLAIYIEENKDCPSDKKDDVHEIEALMRENIYLREKDFYKREALSFKWSQEEEIRNEIDIDFKSRNPDFYVKPTENKKNGINWFLLGGIALALSLIYAGGLYIKNSLNCCSVTIDSDQIINVDENDLDIIKEVIIDK